MDSTICGLRKALNIIGGKWKILILCSIYECGVMRYGELRRKIDGITNTMLAQSLHELEDAKLVTRQQFNEMPLRVEYSLTPKCETLIPILLELKDWSEKNI
ncbi:MAG: helix-turn-helix transcriptional regulator [Selenomonadaceae bacterium]|nr:helix-turn-helix transcriptional regulator [Selenomonadaceae bacterium]